MDGAGPGRDPEFHFGRIGVKPHFPSTYPHGIDIYTSGKLLQYKCLHEYSLSVVIAGLEVGVDKRCNRMRLNDL